MFSIIVVLCGLKTKCQGVRRLRTMSVTSIVLKDHLLIQENCKHYFHKIY